MPLLLSSDTQYAAVRADLELDAQDLEAESWSLAVDQQYVKKHLKEMVKRQDVIYGECDLFRCSLRYNLFVEWVSCLTGR